MSENVVSIVGTKLRNLPKPVQECLKLCSCLGSRFEETFLSEIQGALSNVDDDSGGEHNIVGDIPLCLDIASRAGLVEPLGCSNQHPGFKFAHDKIFESALHLFSDERDRARTHFEIGKLLWRRRFCGNDADTIMKLSDRELFLCTDQLNRGREFVVDKSLRIKLAELNWHAAQRAEPLLVPNDHCRIRRAQSVECSQNDTIFGALEGCRRRFSLSHRQLTM